MNRLEALRHAWTEVVTPDDYEQHMAAIGQAEANAHLVKEMIEARPPEPGSTILFAGAGTGQMLDFVDPSFLKPYKLIFTDIRQEFLDRLSVRAERAGLQVETRIQDLDNYRDRIMGIEATILVLVLEHVDWSRALTITRSSRMYIVIQVNPPELQEAVSPNRVLPPSMDAVSKRARPKLIKRRELIKSMAYGYTLTFEAEKPVLDGKSMAGLVFEEVVTPLDPHEQYISDELAKLSKRGRAATERRLRALYNEAKGCAKVEVARFVGGWRSGRANALADEWIDEVLSDPEGKDKSFYPTGHNQLFFLLPPRQIHNIRRDLETWYSLLDRPNLPVWALDAIIDNFPCIGRREPERSEAIERLAGYLDNPAPEIRWTAIFRLATIQATQARDRIAALTADRTKTRYYGYVSRVAKNAVRFLDGDYETDLYEARYP